MKSAPLAGLRIVEFSAFIPAPLGGMTLSQLGAEVIRIDQLGGNIDFRRMPRAPSGDSIYWEPLPAPVLGAETANILKNIAGLSRETILSLEQQGIIAPSIHSSR